MFVTMLSAYESIVHWQPNVFLIPFGKAGKQFVREITRLYRAFEDNSALDLPACDFCITTIVAAKAPQE